MPADTSWFVRDRFGLFIHWGLYAQGARHEWLMHNESIPIEEYERRYFKTFDPDLYDPELWAQTAWDAGMRYFVATTKHHDGFCLWDSKLTDYKAPNSPAKRDLIRPMVNAFRGRGLRVGLYHSLLDWHHPQCVIDNRNGPYRALSPQKMAAMNAGRDQAKYAAYLHGQVRELLTGYGDIDVLWFDFSYPNEDGSDNFTTGKGHAAWNSEELMRMIRTLQPNVMLTDRLDLKGQPVDFKTPEQVQPRAWPEIDGKRVVWEACQTMSGSWGYHRDEASWRSTEQLVQTLIDCVSKGGNLLLNVGPTGRGEFDARAMDRLKGIGKWMQHHARSIYGCTEAPAGITAPPDSRLTYNPQTNRLYIHLFAWPYKHVHVEGLGGKVAYAQLLHDASEVGTQLDAWHAAHLGEATPAVQDFSISQTRPDVVVPVIEAFLKDGAFAK